MKGFNSFEVGEIVAKKCEALRPFRAIGIDASRFDQHVNTYSLKWEHSLYLKAFSGLDRIELARLLRMQEKYSGKIFSQGLLL